MNIARYREKLALGQLHNTRPITLPELPRFDNGVANSRLCSGDRLHRAAFLCMAVADRRNPSRDGKAESILFIRSLWSLTDKILLHDYGRRDLAIQAFWANF